MAAQCSKAWHSDMQHSVVVLPPLSARQPAPSSLQAVLCTQGSRGSPQSRRSPRSRNALAPLWLGSAHFDQEVPAQRSILEVVPPERRRDRRVQEIDTLEVQAASCCGQGRWVKAAEQLEQALDLRWRLLGEAHQETFSCLEAYVRLCNSGGLCYMRAGNMTDALVLFKKAEAITEAGVAPGFARRMPLRVATLGNLCCYFRARGKLNAALQYAERALALPEQPNSNALIAALELNCAALLSMANRHEDALERLEHARTALQLEEDDLCQPSRDASFNDSPSDKFGKRRQEASHMLVALRHNAWVELAHLGRDRDAADSLRMAAYAARQRLGAAHPWTIKVEDALSKASDRFFLPPQRPSPPAMLTGLPGEEIPAELKLSTRKDGKVPDAVRLAVCPPTSAPPAQRTPRAVQSGAAWFAAAPKCLAVEARQRLAESSFHVGSPCFQQKALGGQPLLPLEPPAKGPAAAPPAHKARRPVGQGSAAPEEEAPFNPKCSRLNAIGLLREQLQEGGGRRDTEAAHAAVTLQAFFRGYRVRRGRAAARSVNFLPGIAEAPDESSGAA
uniref:MalT-like TPR region domain-containing protein n=1 Tax=Alexandrium monilatum TaxID=311494 RepID=A0A7S4UGA5_9DINO